MEKQKRAVEKDVSYFKKNNQEKFNRLYQMYKRYVYNISYQYLQDAYLAEDSTQNTFETIMKSMEVFQDVESIETKRYIAATAKNQSFNMYHKFKKHTYFYSSIDDLEKQEYVASNDNTEIVLHQEALRELMIQINNLPEIYSEMLVLKYVYQLSCKEISDKLGVPYSTIRKRMERAKHKLADGIKQDGYL